MELRMLGGVDVMGPVAAAPIGPTARTLLAVLLAHRREVVTLERLADAVWGDDLPPTARATLQTHLSKLRRTVSTVPGASLDRRAPGYVLAADPTTVDADRFEELVIGARAVAEDDPPLAVQRLDAALACWHGDALAGFADRAWAQAEAVRLDELRLTAAEERIDLLLAAGDDAELLPDLEALVAANPLRERLWCQLMLGLHRAGRQAEALRSAQDVRRHLGEQLGLEPSARLRDLEQAIATDDPSLRADAPVTASPGPEGSTAPSRLGPAVPGAATPLVGRAHDLDALGAALATTRLLTLVGPGGVGKTRLAFELARRVAGPTDPTRVVELAPVTEDEVVAAVAAALGVERRPGRSLEESIVELLAPQRLLLVADNCEHVLPAVGRLTAEVLRWCPEVRVLTTSREALGMPGEHVWTVSPLPVPSDPDATVDELRTNPAIQVFVERAAGAAPGFELGKGNARAVVDLCIQLDGMPLALELAAARMRSMSPGQLLDRLHERYALLSQGSTAAARHRTLHDLVQWSYELLSPTEQMLLARLSVFSGGFDLESVEQTCADDELPLADIARLLAALVDKSLVVAVPGEASVRFHQLETVRQFGAEELRGRPSEASVRRAHRETFALLADATATGLDGPDEAAWATRLDREYDNLRAAVRSAVADGDVDTGLRLVTSSRELSFRRMRYELVRWAEDVAALPGADAHPLFPLTLAIVAYGTFVRGDLLTAIHEAERSLAAATRLGVVSEGLAERALANALVYRGDREAGLRWMARMVEASEKSGVEGRIAHGCYMHSVALTSFGDSTGGAAMAGVAHQAARRAGSPTALSQARYAEALARSSQGDPDASREAIALLDDAVEGATAVGNRWMRAFALTESLWLRSRLGDTHDALVGYREVVATWFQSGDWANQWLSLRQLAGILASIGRDEDAALLFGAVIAVGARAALPLAPTDAADLEKLGGQLEDRLGTETLAAHRRRGELMRDEAVVATALAAIDDVL